MRRVTGVIAIMLALMVGVSFTVTDEVSAASKPSKVTISSAKSADYNAVKVTWKKAKNATSYQVYRATSKSGKYKKIKTTSETSYTNGKLTTGKKYYYKVRALNGKTKGSFSSVKSATPKLKTPSVTQSAGTTSVKLTWGKVNGAKGYQIYRATSKSGKYKKLKTTSSTSWTNSKLSSGKTYYYKVRAYRKSGSKTVYSSYKSFTAKTHAHKWTPVYASREVQVGTETKTVTYGVCNCGYRNSDINIFSAHTKTHMDAGEPSNSSVEQVNEEIPIYETQQYVDYYKCSCGATK